MEFLDWGGGLNQETCGKLLVMLKTEEGLFVHSKPRKLCVEKAALLLLLRAPLWYYLIFLKTARVLKRHSISY